MITTILLFAYGDQSRHSLKSYSEELLELLGENESIPG